MAWTSPLTWVSQALTAALLNEQLRDNMNETAPGIATATGRLIVTDGANSIVERIPTIDEVATTETTASTSYTDLATAGPAVTVTTGTTALVILSGFLDNSGASDSSLMAFAVTGATSLSAADTRGTLFHQGVSESGMSVVTLEPLSAGSNTFTAKYRATGGTASFRHRKIIVIPF